MKTLGIAVYDGVDLLDVMGPYEMLSWVSVTTRHALQVLLLSEHGEAVTSGNGLTFHVHASFAQTPALDILWVPGATPETLERMLQDEHSAYFRYLREIAGSAEWVCSVCEGALLLARAGLLRGHHATTHWAYVKCLERFEGVTVDREHRRFVVSGNRLTGGGISAGLDESLKLIELLFDREAANAVQVLTQYFPDPPADGRLGATPDCKLCW